MSDEPNFREELSQELERAAAVLWRAENPDKSVFDCGVEEKTRYRRRAWLEQRG